MMKYKELRDTVFSLLRTRKGETVAIYPFGDKGLDLKQFIDNVVPAMKYTLIDNVLAEYNPNVHTLDDFMKTDYIKGQFVFLLTISNSEVFLNSLIEHGISERDIAFITRDKKALIQNAMIYYAMQSDVNVIYDYDAWFIRENYISRQLFHITRGWNYEIGKKRWLTAVQSKFPVQDVIYEHVAEKPDADIMFCSGHMDDMSAVEAIVDEHRANCRQIIFFDTNDILDEQIVAQSGRFNITTKAFGTLRLMLAEGERND